MPKIQATPPRNESHLRFTLVLALFSSLVLAGGFLLQGSLYWDTGRIFPQFRDNLHALNQFGEIAWWFPHNQMGSPGYYHSILGIPTTVTPPFVLLATICFLLGRMGIFIQHYQPLYVFYFALFIPTLFLLALRTFINHLFTDGRVSRYVLILGAFSPGILFNLSDVGYLEPTIYVLTFTSACLNFSKKDNFRNRLALVFSALCVGLAFNHAFLYWDLFAIPTFLICLWVGIGKPRRFKVSTVHVGLWVILSFLIGAMPNLIAQGQGSELIRSSLGLSKSYPLERLAAGNPLEVITIGTPGFGFDWDTLREKWTLMPLSNLYHSAYYYLGLLALPLALLALLYTHAMIRITLFLIAIFYFGILPLSAHSPFFAPLLALPSPLRSCNHFSDAGFKAGSYLFLILASGFGMQLLAGGRRRREFFILFLGTSALSVGIHFFLLGKSTAESLSTGLLFFSILFYGLLLFNFQQSKNRKNHQIALSLLLIFTLFDVSTHSFLWIRNILSSKLVMNSGWGAIHRIDETPGEANIGLRNGGDNHYYANTLLVLRPYYEMLVGQFNPYALPPFRLYFEAHQQGPIRDELKNYAQSRGMMTSLPLAMPFHLESAPEASIDVNSQNVGVQHRTYSTLELVASSPAAGLLFIRDAYSPYWQARVDGREAPVLQAFYNFKAVPVPKGTHTISLAFKPPGVGIAIAFAYFSFLTLGLVWLVSLTPLHSRRRPSFAHLPA